MPTYTNESPGVAVCGDCQALGKHSTGGSVGGFGLLKSGSRLSQAILGALNGVQALYNFVIRGFKGLGFSFRAWGFKGLGFRFFGLSPATPHTTLLS